MRFRYLLPGGLGDYRGAYQRSPFDVVHEFGEGETLVPQGIERSGGDGVDETGLEAHLNIGGGQRDGVEAVGFPQFQLVVRSGPGEHVELAEVVKPRHGLAGKEVDPAGIAPVEHDIAIGFDPLFELGRQAVAHVIELVVGIEHQRDLQGGDALLDIAHARAGEGHGLDQFHAQLVDRIGLVAHHAAGIEGELDVAIGNGLPAFAHADQHIAPGRILGRQRGHFDFDRLCAGPKRQAAQ